MSRWFAINRQYYQLNQFTHFEPEQMYNSEKWYIKGYLNFSHTADEETHPDILIQGSTTIGGYENHHPSRDKAARMIEEILMGHYDFQVQPDTIMVKNSEDEDGNYGLQVLTHAN